MRFLFFSLLFLTAVVTSAQQQPYGLKGNGVGNNVDFVRLNPTTGTTTTISTLSGIDAVVVSSTAVNTSTGHFLFQAPNGTGSTRLVAVDTATGAIIHNNVLNDHLVGFDYSCNNNTVYGLANQGSSFDLVTVNPATAATTTIASINTISTVVIGGVALNPDQYQYYVLSHASGQLRLYTLSLFNGSIVDNVVVNAQVSALRNNCLLDKLYGLRSIGGSMSLVSIEPTTGAVTTEVNLPMVDAYVVESAALHAASNTYTFIGIENSDKRLYTIDLTTNTLVQNQPTTGIIASLNVPNCCAGFPSVDFSANQTTITAGDFVNFTDFTTNNPTSWDWEFNGAVPNQSTVQNPQFIQYNTPGCYTVKLTAQNGVTSSYNEKICYIQVDPIPAPPTAGFSATPTSVGQGQPVTFTDQSSSNTTSWQWSFPGGTPSSATGASPGTVTYSAQGTYGAALIATNAYGSDTLIIPNYITVIDTSASLFVDFSVNDPIGFPGDTFEFTNLSTHHDSCVWTFHDVTPFHSHETHPSNVVFTQPGCHAVSLWVEGGPGNETTTKTCYITILEPVTGLAEIAEQYDFKLYPNPAEDQTQLVFEQPVAQPSATLFDFTGRAVREIRGVDNRQLILPLDGLGSGMYLVTVFDAGTPIGTRKLIVQ